MAKPLHRAAVLVAALLLIAAAPETLGAGHEGLPTEVGDESAQSGMPYKPKVPIMISSQVEPLLGNFFTADDTEAVKEIIESPEMDTKVFDILAKYCYEDQDFTGFQTGMADTVLEIGALAEAEINNNKTKADIENELAPFMPFMAIMCDMMPEKPLIMCNATQAEVLSVCPFYTPDIMDVWMSGVPPEAAIFGDLGAVCMADNCTKAIAESGCFEMEGVIQPVMGLCGCHAKLVEVDDGCDSVLTGTAAAFAGAVETVTMSLATGAFDATSPDAMTLKSASGICPAEDGSHSTCMASMHEVPECLALMETLIHPAMNTVCCVLGVAEDPKCGDLLADLAGMSTSMMPMSGPAMTALAVLEDEDTSSDDKIKAMEDAGFETYGDLMTGVFTGVCGKFDFSALETCAPKMACLDSLDDESGDHSGRRLQAGHMGGGDDMEGPGLSEGIEQMQALCDPDACGRSILTECLMIPMEATIKMSELMEGDMPMSGRSLLEHRRGLLAGHEGPPVSMVMKVLGSPKELMDGEDSSKELSDMAKELGPQITGGVCRQECYDAITACKDEPDLFGLGDNSEVEATCEEMNAGDGSSAVSAAARFAPLVLAAAAALALA